MSAVDPENRDDVVRELTFAAENDVDYIAASFVQSADDVNRMREILLANGVNIPIIAKIENRAGVDNLDAIVAAADGVMVARGDLGVELPMADVPGMQKKIIRTTVSNGKPVITATQMLASMERNPKPTRAEASDVANAILDGSSAVMLSGETAAGKYPVEAVRTMAELAVRAEASLREYGYLQRILPHPSRTWSPRPSASPRCAWPTSSAPPPSSALTETGFTSRLMSKHRPECPILAVTGFAEGRAPAVHELGRRADPVPDGKQTDDAKIAFAIEKASEQGFVKPGDILIVTASHSESDGGTNLIRVLTVDS